MVKIMNLEKLKKVECGVCGEEVGVRKVSCVYNCDICRYHKCELCFEKARIEFR